jgi:uncharacterized protein YjbI with pentapeptide repeats
MAQMSNKSKDQMDQDFSGLDVESISFEGIDFHESVFNGTYFTNVEFRNCNLRHTEFTEAKFMNCKFMDSDLDYSDFVYSQVTDVTFQNCSFSHVEWRESKFYNNRIVNSTFNNSTVSLCSFALGGFDDVSSQNFCGASKRYNVFSNVEYTLVEEKVGFLQINYGIQHNRADKELTLNQDYLTDTFLVLSALKYNSQLSSETFVELLLKGVEELSYANQKNHVQKIKYLALICKQTIEGNTIPVFAMQFILISLNTVAKQIKDPAVFMELIDLIMFLKTYQYQAILSAESEVKELAEVGGEGIRCQIILDKSYPKEDVHRFLRVMGGFLSLSDTDIEIKDLRNGSTILDFIINHYASLMALVLFINFSLSQISKTFEHLATIKKNFQSLFKKKEEKTTGIDLKKDVALIPFTIMSNEGNIYYNQINNTVQNYGRDVLKLNGPGTVKFILPPNFNTT